MSITTWGLVIWRSVVTSWNPGSARSFASSSGAQWYSSAVSASWSVYWYWLLVTWPPTWIDGRFWRYTRTPGHRGQLRAQRLDDLVGA